MGVGRYSLGALGFGVTGNHAPVHVGGNGEFDAICNNLENEKILIDIKVFF